MMAVVGEEWDVVIIRKLDLPWTYQLLLLVSHTLLPTDELTIF